MEPVMAIEVTRSMVAIVVGVVGVCSMLGGFLGAGLKSKWKLDEVYTEVFDKATGLRTWRARTDVELAEIKVRCATLHAERSED